MLLLRVRRTIYIFIGNVALLAGTGPNETSMVTRKLSHDDPFHEGSTPLTNPMDHDLDHLVPHLPLREVVQDMPYRADPTQETCVIYI